MRPRGVQIRTSEYPYPGAHSPSSRPQRSCRGQNDAARLMVPADQELQLCRPIHAGRPPRTPGTKERAERSPGARSSRPDETATCALLLFGGSARHPQSPVEAVGRAVMSQPYASPVRIANFKTRPPSWTPQSAPVVSRPELESRLSPMKGIGSERRHPKCAPRNPKAEVPSRSGRNLSALVSAINAGRKTYGTSARPLAGGNCSRAGDRCLPYSAVFIAG